MSIHQLEVSGNLRSQQTEILKADYTKILSTVWNKEPLWKHIQNKTLTAATCMVGREYDRSPVKLMFVGRAVNGWEISFADCSSPEATAQSVLKQENILDEFARDYTIEESGKKYYYARSPFLRFMKKTVKAFNGTEENWQQRLIWSNLFKVAPRHRGNPSWAMVRNDIPLYREILEQEILMYHPDLVIFVTDMSFFDCRNDNKRCDSFLPLLKPATDSTDWQFVQTAGTFAGDPDVKIIVCCRPEQKKADDMIHEIQTVYQSL